MFPNYGRVRLLKTKEQAMSPTETVSRVNEPTLDEIFSDPMIQLMMQRDGTQREAIERALLRMATMNRHNSTLQ